MSSPTSPVAEPLPAGSKPKLTVVRGQRPGASFGVKEGVTQFGRSGDDPVDVDLDVQERPGQVFAARQHARIYFEDSILTIEDSGTANGTYVNRVKIAPNQRYPLKAEDLIQIGTVQFQVKVKVKKATGVAK